MVDEKGGSIKSNAASDVPSNPVNNEPLLSSAEAIPEGVIEENIELFSKEAYARLSLKKAPSEDGKSIITQVDILDEDPLPLIEIKVPKVRRGSVASDISLEDSSDTQSIASEAVSEAETLKISDRSDIEDLIDQDLIADLPIADEGDFPRWEDRGWFQRDERYQNLESLFSGTKSVAIYGDITSLSKETLGGHKIKRGHNGIDGVWVEVNGQATVFGEGHNYFNQIHRELDFVREKVGVEEGNFAWDQKIINFRSAKSNGSGDDNGSNLYVTASIFADGNGAFTSQTFLSEDEVKKLKDEDQKRCNEVAKAEIRSNAASIIVSSLSSIGADTFNVILGNIDQKEKESLKDFFGIQGDLTLQNVKSFFEGKKHKKLNPDKKDIDSILADNDGDKDQIIEILLNVLGDDDKETKKTILTNFFKPENCEENGQIPLSSRSREIASRLHRESRADSFKWKEIDSESVKRFTDRYTGDQLFRNHDYAKMLQELIRQGSGAVTITNGFNANGTRNKFNVKISFDEHENSDLGTAYIHIPGSNNLYVRARVCQKNGPMKYYENGKLQEMECLKGDIIIDRGTIFEMTQSGKYDPFPVCDLNDKRHHDAEKIKQNYNKLRIVAKSNYEVEKSHDKNGKEIEKERFDVATLVNGDSRDKTYKQMHEIVAQEAKKLVPSMQKVVNDIKGMLSPSNSPHPTSAKSVQRSQLSLGL